MDRSAKSESSQALTLFKHCEIILWMSINKKNHSFNTVGGYLYSSLLVKVPNATTIKICPRGLSCSLHKGICLCWERSKVACNWLCGWKGKKKNLFCCVSVPMTNFKWWLLFSRSGNLCSHALSPYTLFHSDTF